MKKPPNLKRFFIRVALAIAVPASVLPAWALDVEGVWLTPATTSKVAITDCGDGTPCGSIAWIDSAALRPDQIAAGGAWDENNPDESLRKRPLIGVTILNNFQRKNNQWKKGRIYDPNDGKSYRSNIRLKNNGTLEVKGCVGPFCQTQIWTPTTLDALPTDASAKTPEGDAS